VFHSSSCSRRSVVSRDSLQAMFAAATAAARGLGSCLARSAAAPLLRPPLLAQPRRDMSIHLKTRLNVIDNTGAKEVECIDFYARKPARLGDAIRVVVKSAKHDGRVSKKDIVGAVVVRQKAKMQRPDGSVIFFQENACVLMKRDLSGPIGTRVTGPVARELRQGRFMKVVLMASRVV
jgi:large subunit ribosomal protein L14